MDIKRFSWLWYLLALLVIITFALAPIGSVVLGVFGHPNLLEAAPSRFKLVDGIGCSIVYSYRIYGEKIGHQMIKWLNDNGPKTEKVLMDWNKSPSPASLRDLPRKQVHVDGTKCFAMK